LSAFESGFIGLGYLMLFDPRRYADLWNQHSRKTGSEKRLSIEKMLWVRSSGGGVVLASVRNRHTLRGSENPLVVTGHSLLRNHNPAACFFGTGDGRVFLRELRK
jgi:hypothetical protein